MYRSFADTGSIATLTYTTDEAIRSGIAMRTLDTKQSVALCLVYLAKGYLYSQPAPDDTFVMDCSELALQYDSLCLSALLLKAEALENRLVHRTPDQWHGDKNFAGLESLIRRLYQLGYRQMPLPMKEIILSRLRKDSTTIRIGATDHTPRPFREISSEQIPYASLSWGRLEEMHTDKPVERYGRTLLDTRNGTISGFARDSVFFNDYFFDPVVFAWQIDPLAHKYPSLSPYHAFANNPILYVDEDGRENVVYLVVAKDKTGKPSIDIQTAKKIAEETNKIYTNLGLKTRVVVFEDKEAFNPAYMDKTDAVAVLGKNKQQVTDYIKEHISIDYGSFLETEGFPNSDNNPERSENGPGNTGGRIIAIGYESVKNFYTWNTKATEEQEAAFTIIHGGGHNSGIGHEEFGIMQSGNSLKWGRYELKNLQNKLGNDKLIQKMKSRFSDNKAEDNYSTNKEKND